MLALTIKPPWAWAIAAGHKRLENRSWAPARLLGQRFAIHAAKSFLPQEERLMRRIAKQAGVALLARGSYVSSAIVATARVVRFVETSSDPWFLGPLAWVLEDVVPVDPIQCKGAQGLWVIPPATEALLPEGSR